MSNFIVYSRENCHLCHDMIQDLRLWQTRLPFSFEVVDIEDNESLLHEFELMIPVLTYGDKIICYGRIDVDTIQQLITDLTRHDPC